jgi:hypothetical protein
MESNDGPRKRFGAKSQMQHDNMDESSEGSAVESDSHSSNSRDSSFEESYDESMRRTPLPRHSTRRQVT